MTDSEHEYTKSEQRKRVSYEEVVTWVRESWDAIDQAIIPNSFLKASVNKKEHETESREETEVCYDSDSVASEFDGFD